MKNSDFLSISFNQFFMLIIYCIFYSGVSIYGEGLHKSSSDAYIELNTDNDAFILSELIELTKMRFDYFYEFYNKSYMESKDDYLISSNIEIIDSICDNLEKEDKIQCQKAKDNMLIEMQNKYAE